MTQNNFKATGLVGYAVSANWSLAHIPLSTEDALINSGAIVISDDPETVNSIAVGNAGGGSVLSIVGGPFIAKNGTGSNTNSGVISVSGATFEVDTGYIDNSGTIELMGGGASVVLPESGVILDGGGSVEATIGGGPNSNKFESGNMNGSPTFVNQDNTISGDVTIGDGLLFTNEGLIETNNNTSSNPGTVAILGTAGVFISNAGNFTNDHIVRADNGGTVILGVDNITGSIDNEGQIALDSTGAATKLEIAGDMTITATGSGGVINLGGTNAQLADEIVSDGNPATLTLVNQTIKGAGFIGDFDLTLDNQSGTIAADNGSLFLYDEGQGPAIINGGTLEALNSSADLWVEQNVNNTGTILAANGGSVILDGTVSGSGAVDIGTDGFITLSNPGQVTGNVTFTGADAFLGLFNAFANSGVGGDIVGAVGSDMIDFGYDPFSATNHLTWQQNGSTGTLSLVNSSGMTIQSVNFAGTYTQAQFSMSGDGDQPDQGTLVTVLNPAPPPATTEVMIMDESGVGAYEIYDIGNNAFQGSGALGQISTSLAVQQLGAFNGSDLYDMLMRNTSTGEFWMYDISGNNITNTTDLGAVGTSWQVLGFGDFSSNPGETDMLMQNSSGGALELYDIANGQFSGFHGIGSVGTSWQVLGFGDFSGNAGESDMLMRNSANGNMELYDIANNSITSFYSMGSVGTSWQVLGFGDFSGHAGEDDMLMRDSSTGNVELYDINNNGYAGFYSMGAIGLSWQVLGFGDFSGNVGEDDMLMRDSTTGNLEVYDINNNGYIGFYSLGAIGTSWMPVGVGDFSGNANEADLLMRNSGTGEFELYDITGNTITKAIDLGGVGTSWTVAGIADPPGAPPANAQLVQAMANYASSAGALDTTSSPGQTATQTTPASLLVPPSGQPQPA